MNLKVNDPEAFPSKQILKGTNKNDAIHSNKSDSLTNASFIQMIWLRTKLSK